MAERLCLSDMVALTTFAAARLSLAAAKNENWEACPESQRLSAHQAAKPPA
jgi:hypothetical protein